MDKDDIRMYYNANLEERLYSKKISRGAFELLKISESSFNDYCIEFEDDKFREKQLGIHKSWTRDKKIDDILNN